MTALRAERFDHAADEPTHTFDAKEFAHDLQSLKVRDNHTNFKHIAFVWAVIAVTVVATIWSYGLVTEAGLSWWWKVLATVVAVVIIGGSQHQLGGIVHEGCHYILFKDKKLNELASDWLAAFPLYTSTYAFRLHHLAHHQFINDPERDPNFKQAAQSGHWLDFPVTHIELLVGVLKQLNPIRCITYIMARAKYSALGVETNPYADSEKNGSPWIVRAGALFAVLTPFGLGYSIRNEMWISAALVLLVPYLAIVAYYALAPQEHFSQSRLNPVISHRATWISRVSFIALMYGSVALTHFLTATPAWTYFALLWLLPLFTTFPLFMVLREWVQHGNADRGRLTNSRVFLVDPVSRYLVLPFGMDYHLPHHIFCSVPHYRLPDLHQLMLRDPEYAEKGVVVEGWMARTAERPTVVDVLGPDFAPSGNTAHVDEDTLELAEVNNREAIDRQIAASRRDGSANVGRTRH
jgi:fatty acid desaturase